MSDDRQWTIRYDGHGIGSIDGPVADQEDGVEVVPLAVCVELRTLIHDLWNWGWPMPGSSQWEERVAAALNLKAGS